MTAPQPARVDPDQELREQLIEALPAALMPVGARLRWTEEFGEPEPLTSYGEFIINRLLPAAQKYAEQQAAQARTDATAEALASALEFAREATRMGFTEGREQEFTRHWAAVSGWLKHRRDAVLAGREPNWPDAADFRAEEDAS